MKSDWSTFVHMIVVRYWPITLDDHIADTVLYPQDYAMNMGGYVN
jgi:hypothetical protein